MKSFHIYYVVDMLSESIVGSFNAISDAMAREVVRKSITENEKLALIKENLFMAPSPDPYLVFETFDEIKEHCSFVPLDDLEVNTK